MQKGLFGNRLRFLATVLWLGAVSVAVLECAARLDDWFHYGAPLAGNYDFDRLFEETAHGVRGVPNARYLRWSLNSDGLRGPEIDPSDRRPRVVAYGASETFGIYEDNGREFPRRLEADLRDSPGDERVQVINAGLPGMRVGSGVGLLMSLAQRYHPRAVVIYPTPTHYIGVTRPYCHREPRLPAQGSDWLPELRIESKAEDLVKRLLPRTAMTVLRQASIWEQLHGRKPQNQADERNLAAFETDLDCVVQAVQELGMTPILVTHANRFGSTPHRDDAYWLTGWRKQYPLLSEAGFVDLELRANEVIRQLGRTDNVVVVDAAAALGGRSELFADHAHFNNLGADAMGKLLAPAVRAALAATPAVAGVCAGCKSATG